MRRRPVVALLIEMSNAYARRLLTGIRGYLAEHGPWSIYLPEQERAARPPQWLARWQGDGIIARIETDAIAKAVTQTGVPVIDVSAARHVPSIPWVETDDAAIARMAAQHLFERGFRNLAFCGDARFNWSSWRRENFERIVRESGCACHVYETPSQADQETSWGQQQRALMAWVKKLPKPVGVMACYDIMAQRLLDACREIDVAVPEDVAVLGVDNDELLCNLSTPPLSSVVPDAERTGYTAAQLIGRMMAGERVKAQGFFIPPIGVVTRQSTDVLAIPDRDVAVALRFIREQACHGINVKNVMSVVPLSRRVLESRFRAAIGRTPHEEIVRLKLDRVKQLLIDTELSLADIAARAGFTHVEYLSMMFKKHMGTPPSDFRRSHRQTRQ